MHSKPGSHCDAYFPSVPTSNSPPNPFNFTFKASLLDLFKRLKINKPQIQEGRKTEAKENKGEKTIQPKYKTNNEINQTKRLFLRYSVG